ncbi:hypothetical protein L227DRAFT_205390 [Lentinus tigrinus ALCF2SS1-6]|uniref:Uncharacterized protein n=1 Tax=Lentinus tigrinus ALCF2SS1-6 TaxID=1328759 RepID=A0A5C2SQ42_9APHY|nr:hypothetical protein L227DRAFT_205390 [Lentinus tigrinus ALCF2SS1-6]
METEKTTVDECGRRLRVCAKDMNISCRAVRVRPRGGRVNFKLRNQASLVRESTRRVILQGNLQVQNRVLLILGVCVRLVTLLDYCFNRGQSVGLYAVITLFTRGFIRHVTSERYRCCLKSNLVHLAYSIRRSASAPHRQSSANRLMQSRSIFHGLDRGTLYHVASCTLAERVLQASTARNTPCSKLRHLQANFNLQIEHQHPLPRRLSHPTPLLACLGSPSTRDWVSAFSGDHTAASAAPSPSRRKSYIANWSLGTRSQGVVCRRYIRIFDRCGDFFRHPVARRTGRLASDRGQVGLTRQPILDTLWN